MVPVLGGEVEEGEQRFPVLGQTGDRLVVLGIVFISEHVDRCLGRRAGWRAVNLSSPESNGIAEAFVKTFKRDYARLSILPDAETVIALLPAWFEDYNEVHPHSGLKFLSPREFLRLSA